MIISDRNKETRIIIPYCRKHKQTNFDKKKKKLKLKI